jgi:molybdopterin converting factor small subunit
MTVVVQLPQALAEDAGGHRELAFELAPSASLADLLADVQARHPALGRRLCDETGAIRRFVNVYVGEDESRALNGLQTPVPPGAVVLVAGSVAGG